MSSKDKNLIRIEKETIREIDGSRNKTILTLKNKITRFKPYIEYYYFKSIGKNEEEAAKLVRVIYDIKQDVMRISKIFESWTKFFDIKYNDKPLEPNNDLEKLNESLNDDILIQKFLREQFGDYYKNINDYVISDLEEALKDYKIDPERSVNDVGRALEDFLRLNFADSINLTKCSGIIQIANELNKHNLSTKKHNGVILGFGHIRSMGDAHGADKVQGERWKIRDSTALFYIILTIKLMISLLEYKKNTTLIF
ncbi:MAG: hypothetical protein SVM80_04165 [Halobacteriota archaeon]|nr:hypothetical protein [Halobacteriota archaeon]